MQLLHKTKKTEQINNSEEVQRTSSSSSPMQYIINYCNYMVLVVSRLCRVEFNFEICHFWLNLFQVSQQGLSFTHDWFDWILFICSKIEFSQAVQHGFELRTNLVGLNFVSSAQQLLLLLLYSLSVSTSQVLIYFIISYSLSVWISQVLIYFDMIRFVGTENTHNASNH